MLIMLSLSLSVANRVPILSDVSKKNKICAKGVYKHSSLLRSAGSILWAFFLGDTSPVSAKCYV